MSDSALEFAEERSLGKVLGRVRLGSGIAIADGSRSQATLLLTSSGLWLVAARDRFHGVQIDLLTRSDVRLVAGRIRDRLHFGQEALLIPAGRRHAVERLLALGRLASAPSRREASETKASRLVHEPDELGKAWLARELADSEVVVCWLRAADSLTLESQIVGQTQARPYLFVSDRRAALVAWSQVGDVTYTPLHADSLRLGVQGEQTELSGAGLFLSRRSDAQAARDAFELIALGPGKARLLEAARRLWLTREHVKHAKEETARSLSLLEAAIAQGSQRARFARLLALADEAQGDAAIDPAQLVRALGEGRLTPALLAELWASWKFSEQAGRALVRGLLLARQEPFALAVQRRIQSAPSADDRVARDDLGLVRFAVEQRLALAAVSDPRDRALREVLAEHGLEPAPVELAGVSNALPSELIPGALSHPLARGQGSLVAGVQKLIAHSPEPDHGALSDYCEALDTREHPEARRALDAARLAFSLPALHAYVSRGKKSIGLRGYEAKAPYILLGKDHLDAASPFRMSEAELFFAIGAEALHLKLGQTRLTSNEIWAGAFAHTKGGVELILGVLPLLQGMPLGPSVTKFLERVPEPALRRGLEALVRFEREKRGKRQAPSLAPPSALSHVNENLLAAHRLMQMSADRAGLLLCGDLRASVRGLLLVRPDTRAVLDEMVLRDVVSVLLDDSAQQDPAMRADLTVRIAALFDFYVSEEYVALRRALCD